MRNMEATNAPSAPPLPQRRDEAGAGGAGGCRPLTHRIVDQHQAGNALIAMLGDGGEAIEHAKRPAHQHHTRQASWAISSVISRPRRPRLMAACGDLRLALGARIEGDDAMADTSAATCCSQIQAGMHQPGTSTSGRPARHRRSGGGRHRCW